MKNYYSSHSLKFFDVHQMIMNYFALKSAVKWVLNQMSICSPNPVREIRNRIKM